MSSRGVRGKAGCPCQPQSANLPKLTRLPLWKAHTQCTDPYCCLPTPVAQFSYLVAEDGPLFLKESLWQWQAGVCMVMYLSLVLGEVPGEFLFFRQLTNGAKITEQGPESLAHVYNHRIMQTAGELRTDIYCGCRNVNFGELLNSSGSGESSVWIQMCTLEELECIIAGNTDAAPGKHLISNTISPSELPVLKLGQNARFFGQGHMAPPEETTLPITLRMVLSFSQTNPDRQPLLLHRNTCPPSQ